MIRRHFGLPALLALALMLAGCTTPPRQAVTGTGELKIWIGRMALRVESDPVQTFSGGFELEGTSQRGGLSLFSPMGGTVAQLTWSADDARLRSDGKEQIFVSLDALTQRLVGVELPIASLFSWLAGEAAPVSGWDVDLRDRSRGRLVARRLAPDPKVELKLVLE